MNLRLVGYRHSVYAWTVRMALAALGRQAEWWELDPFALEDGEALALHHPFGRVPVLWDGATRIYETGAILAYLFPSEPEPGPLRAARARQVAGIVDSYAYPVFVRQVFSHGAFRPWCGMDSQGAVLEQGLAKAPRILAALEEIAAEGRVLTGHSIKAAECHLAPMLGYFALVPDARALLEQHTALARWFAGISAAASYLNTRPPIFGEAKT